jgi:hypothetical protein
MKQEPGFVQGTLSIHCQQYFFFLASYILSMETCFSYKRIHWRGNDGQGFFMNPKLELAVRELEGSQD